MFFCQSALEAGTVKFGKVDYQPVDVEFSGFEVNGGGALPTPKMRLANTDGVIQDIVNTYGDLVGCPIARVRTFRQHLDDGLDPDPGRFLGPDVFRIERKVSETDTVIEWELSAAIDQEGTKLPRRTVMRDYCPWRYRMPKPDGTDFQYHTGTNACPYAGSAMFDRLGNPVTDRLKDSCSQDLTGCRLRYGKDQPLPFGGFPGVARVRV